MTTATATATTSMPDMTNKDHEDFLDFLSDTNTESGDSSSCPSSPDEDGSLVLSSTGDENDDNTLESLLAMDVSGIDLDLQLIDSPRKPSAPPQPPLMPQIYAQKHKQFLQPGKGGQPFPMLLPVLPQPIATPLVMPPHFLHNKNNVHMKQNIPTAVPLCPSTFVPALKPAQPRHPKKPCASSEDRKRKREERLAKNRESANKSRLKRKQNLAALTSEVTSLQQQLHQATSELVASRAENNSLKEQNAYLRSLISPLHLQAVGKAPPVVPTASAATTSTTPRATPAPAVKSMSRATSSVLFAVAMSCAFLSDPFDISGSLAGGTTSGNNIPASARGSGRVLLSTGDASMTTAQSYYMSFPAMTIPHMSMPPISIPQVHFSQRVFESVVINLLTLGCSALVFLAGVAVLRRFNLATTVLPIFYKPKAN
jgi:hypothetical protein